ncbi:MAG: exodeoxyribonuclease V subunit alpha [Spirochaetes bacterium]|nr:MAG: exodeoxyribonuclease V subunit alpha [Spirochaetota bacterium]
MAVDTLENLRAFAGEAGFSPLDRRLSEFLVTLGVGEDSSLYLACLAASRATAEGNICAHLPSLAGLPVAETPGVTGNAPDYPPLAEWRSAILRSGVAGRPGDFTPLVLDEHDRLYLYRYWRYERDLAQNIGARLALQREPADPGLLRDGLNRLFGAAIPGETDWQKIAALNAVMNGFSVISGGPGTGKSRTVARILALLIEQALAAGTECSIALCAPTGKAAARLQESIAAARNTLASDGAVRARLPDDASTIHRLLGPSGGTPYFRHDSGNPLPHDIVVVDESSMADLALMAKLADAVRPEARLILLGDRDQLASVEAGAVLGDICDTGREHRYSGRFVGIAAQYAGEDLAPLAGGLFEKPIADSIVILRRSYRFGSESGIGKLGGAVREGDADAAMEVLTSGKYPGVRLLKPGEAGVEEALRGEIDRGAFAFAKAKSPEEAFDAYARFIVLCALRGGPAGVEGVNRLIEHELGERGLPAGGGRFYAGRPVMITRNDHRQRLYNGDVGIVMDGGGAGARTAVFRDEDGGFRHLSPVRMPEHMTVYAMTVHKSQGSEFDSVMLVLPETVSPVLTRELVYTALTRARESVLIGGSAAALRYAIGNPVSRASGLRDMLWG